MMTNQIFDRRTIGIPGATGDLTPELLAAKNAAEAAASAASVARTAAQSARTGAETARTTATNEANRAKTEADRAKTEADRAENAGSGGVLSINGKPGPHPVLTATDVGAVPSPLPNATTTVRGIVELATNAEASAATDTTRAVSPSGLAAFLDSVQVLGAADGAKYRIVSGVIRNVGGTQYWQLLNDSGHVSVGIASVVTDDTKIRINFSSLPAGAKVVYGDASVDETLAQNGYSVGASVGTANLDVYLVRERIQGYAEYNGTAWTTQGDVAFGAFLASGLLRLDHAPIAGFGISVHERGGALRAQVASLGAEASTLQFVNTSGTVVTTPTTAMRVYLTRVGGGSIDPRPVPPAGHNIWIFAVLEMP